MQRIKLILIKFVPFGVAITLILGTVYLVVQQNYRLSANDPQIQIAEDAENALKEGKSAKNSDDLIEKIDIEKSLATYMIEYDKTGALVIGNGYVDGKNAELPRGVYDYAKQHGEDRFTWQPKKGVRSAGVLVYYKGKNEGFVFAGRSLRETEKRIDLLTKQVGLAWFLTLLSTFFVVGGVELFSGRIKH